MEHSPVSHFRGQQVARLAQAAAAGARSTASATSRPAVAFGLGVDHLYAPSQLFTAPSPQVPHSGTTRSATSLGRRSRTENPMGIMSGKLHQHQRVHDADEHFFAGEPPERFGRYYDPRRSSVFQSAIGDRPEDRRQRQRPPAKKASAKNAGEVPDGELMGDVVSTVATIMQAKRHRAASDVSPELILRIRHLVRSAAMPVLRPDASLGRRPELGGGRGPQGRHDPKRIKLRRPVRVRRVVDGSLVVDARFNPAS